MSSSIQLSCNANTKTYPKHAQRDPCDVAASVERGSRSLFVDNAAGLTARHLTCSGREIAQSASIRGRHARGPPPVPHGSPQPTETAFTRHSSPGSETACVLRTRAITRRCSGLSVIGPISWSIDPLLAPSSLRLHRNTFMNAGNRVDPTPKAKFCSLAEQLPLPAEPQQSI
jgi:hypothetical protein